MNLGKHGKELVTALVTIVDRVTSTGTAKISTSFGEGAVTSSGTADVTWT